MNELALFPDLPVPDADRCYVGLGLAELIKIGHSMRGGEHRGGELHFSLLAELPGGNLTERRLHRHYAAERLGTSEWFKLSDRLLLDLIHLAAKQGRRQAERRLREIALARMGRKEAA